MNSKFMFEKALKLSPGGVQSPVRSFRSVGGTPVFFTKSRGAFLYDMNGKDYIDFCMSFGPLLLGHRDPEVEEVVKETVELSWSFGACEPYSVELAEFITSHIPWVERIRFVSSGTEAVMTALRLARGFTGREKILKFDGCYHGHADSMLVKSGSGLAGEASSDSAGVGKSVTENTLVLPLDNEKLAEELFARQGKEIACVIIEPLPANYGLLIQRKEFIEKIMSLAKNNGSLVIFDEVISGFRTGFQGMSAEFTQKPDLITYGKVIGGGFPVGAYGGRSDIMSMIAPEGPVYQAGTLSGNPFGMRAGLATLRIARSLKIYEMLAARTMEFVFRLTELLNSKSEFPWKAAYHSSLFWLHADIGKPIRTIEDIPAGHKENFAKLYHKLLEQGIYLAPSGYEVGFLSLAHSERILDMTLERAKKALSA